MSMDLDKRHRAMLREMGVRVWLPVTAPVAVAAAVDADVAVIDRPASPAVAAMTAAPMVAATAPAPVQAPRAAPPAPTPATRTAPAPGPSSAAAQGVAVSWRLGEAVPLYADAAHAQGPRWLVLAETPAATLQAAPVFDPFLGDAGKLLDNMLRAARLHQAGVVLLAPLTRQAAAAAEPGLPAMQDRLAALIASAQPDIVLVMGRLASLALLQSGEPFGKLRGQVHQLHGARTVVTCDATYLLRNQADKARAWDDLCLAMGVVAG